MPIVSIADLNNVIVDGVPSGHLIDAVRNKPLAAADLKAAFDVWYLGRLEYIRDTDAKALADVAAAKAKADADLAAKEAAHAAELAALNADREALGGTELAIAMKAAKEAEARDAKVAALRAELATLVEADPEPTTSTPESVKP